jgi:hypothetical protein
MAGKAEGEGAALGTNTGDRMGLRLTRAYAEGRLGTPANPHVAGTPESNVWIYADANKADPTKKFETAVP